MPGLLRELFQRPSRLVGWSLVVLIHLFMWQVLSRGLNGVRAISVLDAVQVNLVLDDAPPQVLPASLPKIEQLAEVQPFVSAPEVSVTQEFAVDVSASVLPAPLAMSDAAPPVVSSPSHSTNLLVVTESEVDYLVRPEVHYPLASKRAKERGLVLLSVVVNTGGSVDYVQVYKSSGYRRLDECASRAVRRMRVKPYIRNGIAMAIELRIPVEFS